MGGLVHPALYAIVAFVGFMVPLVVALQDPVPGWELRLTEWINDAPDAAADVLYPVMQLGTMVAPLAVGLLVLVFRRDWLLAAATVVVGLAAWFGAKTIKQWVERGRPRVYLPEINVREGTGEGLGFISGHSAVGAAAVVMAIAALPRPLRPIALAVGVLVGVARIVHGVHLPADVVGGWCFGVLIALGGLWVVDRIQARLDLRAGAITVPA
jgi:undecaprenyl-diphosphatase